MPNIKKSGAGGSSDPGGTSQAREPAPMATPPTDAQGTGRSQDQHPGGPVHPGVPLAPPGIVPESDVRVHTPAAAVPPPEHGLVNEGLGELPWAYGEDRKSTRLNSSHLVISYA